MIFKGVRSISCKGNECVIEIYKPSFQEKRLHNIASFFFINPSHGNYIGEREKILVVYPIEDLGVCKLIPTEKGKYFLDCGRESKEE